MHQKIEQLLQNGYSFSVSEVLSEAWQITKSKIGIFIGFWLTYGIISGVLSNIPLIGQLISSFIIGPALMAGLAIYLDRYLHNDQPEFSNFFDGFRLLNQLIPYALLYQIIVLIAGTPLWIVLIKTNFLTFSQLLSGNNQMLAFEQIPGLTALLSSFDIVLLLAGTFLLIYVSMLYWWSIYFITLHKMSFWQAMESSRKLISRALSNNFKLLFSLIGIIFGLAVVGAFLISIFGISLNGGLILLLILLALPLMLFIATFITIAPFVAFHKVVGSREEDHESDFSEHLLA